jgi:hypothetical protein
LGYALISAESDDPDEYMMLLFRSTPFASFRVSISMLLILAASNGALQARQHVDLQVSTVDKTATGFDMSLRLGHWIPVSFHLNPNASVRPSRFEITCPDGDGTTTTFEGNLKSDDRYPDVVQASFRMGRGTSEIDVKLFSKDEIVDRFQLAAGSQYTVLPSTQRMILVIEPTERITTTIRTTISGLKSKPLVAHLTDLSELPLDWKCYQGINQLILAADSVDQIKSIGAARLNAIKRWLSEGGELLLCVGQGGDGLLTDGGALQAFCPGSFAGIVQLNSSKRIEFFASGSKSQLLPDDGNQTIPAVRVDDTTGVVMLSEGDVPLIIEQSFGFGKLTFVAMDLDSDLFHAWPGNVNLIHQLVLGDDESSAAQSPASGRVSHYGYDDLVGQLRVPLDQFTRAQMITFTWVAVLIALFILCIGPGDYFLLRKVIGRMEFTWITFGLMTAAFCAVAWFTVKNTKPERFQLNQLEVVDIDALSGDAKGTIWANLFSPNTSKLDLDLVTGNSLGIPIEDSEIVWHGLPGNGLGGMSTSAATAIAGEDYRIVLEDNDAGRKVRVEGLPMRVSSSKAVFGTWSGEVPAKPLSQLKFNPSIQKKRLEGTLTNPLDKPLNNCRILFEDWVYVLERPLEPGETIDIVTETREKYARSHYNRKVSKEDKSSSTPWDPTDTRLNRIAEMMLFYRAAGGQGYTGLTHDYQASVDMSHLPNLNRAILVGEFAGHVTDILINGQAPSADNCDHQLTILRVSLPVQQAQKSNSTN